MISRQKVLTDLLDSLSVGYSINISRNNYKNTEVTGIVLDSRNTMPGNLFVAIEGGALDGHEYIQQSIANGAVAIVGSREIEDLPVPYIRVEDSRQALASLSAAFYDFPARHLTVVGITGTDGKTTTANLVYSILRSAGIQAGMITTVSAIIGENDLDTGFHVTTPEAPDVQKYLSLMVEEGLSHVVLEATSHGLAQQRVAFCEFDVGIVTNITHEHLDYHKTYEDYREAKALLFISLSKTTPKPHVKERFAILNRDDESYPYLSLFLDSYSQDEDATTQVKSITYGLSSDADIFGENIEQDFDGLRFTAKGCGYQFAVESGLVGGYNVYNCLAAITATLIGLGIPLDAVQAGIAGQPSIPGRMEQISMGTAFRTIVDFAHTPNALFRSLSAARKLLEQQALPGRIIAIFGSAGLRDREKRRLMAEVSAELADVTILTAEDPRTEALKVILEEMANGARAMGGVEGKTFYRVHDRGDAIRFGIELAKPGDIVMALGKGHEQSMCFGETEYAWDDRTAMRAAIADYLKIPGPPMPYLPTQSG